MRRAGEVAAADLPVAPQLPADRGRTALQLRGDRPHGRARRTRQPDLLALGERQTPALQATPTARAHTPVGNHPPCALLAIRARRHRRVADELATLQLGPKHLHVLRDHVISEPHGQHLHSVRCCDHRENPSFGMRDGGGQQRRRDHVDERERATMPYSVSWFADGSIL